MSRTTSDLLRVIAIFAVMAIHATADRQWLFQSTHAFFTNDFLGVLLNQLARFSVPVFVALSGFGLTMKYMGSAGTGVLDRAALRDFFAGRAVKILLPFVALTVAYFFLLNRYAWNPALDAGANIGANASALLGYLTTHGVDYHFYFFIIILQCYLVFPLLFKARRWGIWSALLGLQLAFTSPAHDLFALLGIERPSFFSAFIVYWAFWFYTGLMLATDRVRIAAFLARIKGWIVLAALALAAAGVVGEYVYKSFTQPDPGWYDHFSRWTVIVFGLATLAAFTRFDGAIAAWLGRAPWRARAATTLAGLSFCVYIFHVWPLRWLNQLAGPYEIVLFSLTLAVLAFGGAWLLSKLVRKPAWLRTILGL